MRFSYILRLAIRNIISHKLRSFLTISGISIGVGFIIFLISLGYGLQRISTEEIANIDALQIIDITPGKSKIIKISDQTIEKFKGLSNVVRAEPQINVVGTLQYKTSTVEGVIYGKNVEYLGMEDIEIEAGDLYGDNRRGEAIVNKAVLKTLGIGQPDEAIGKNIIANISIGPEFFDNADNTIKKTKEFKIVGVMVSEDSPYMYLPLDAFKDYGIINYNSAKIMVDNKINTDIAKKQVESLGFKATTLKDTVDQINQFFTIFQLILLAFGAIAVLIAAIGMFNTLTISLLEKTREISFMKILGTASRDVWHLFITEAIMIGLIGAVAGIGFGLATGISLNSFFISLAERTGNKPVEIFYTPPLLVVATFLSTMIISFLTGVYPSHRASKVDALETMRYE